MMTLTVWRGARWVALGLVLTLAGQANATGIPVIDIAGLTQALEQFKTLTDQLAKMEEQLATAKAQLTSLQEQAATVKSTYDSLTGISGQAQMFQNVVAQLHSFLPGQLQEVSGLMTGEVGAMANAMRQAKQQFDSATLFPGQALAPMKAQYEQASDYLFTYAAQAKTAFDGFAGRRANLETLSTAATTAPTTKATLDLIAKATAENALLLNDIAQMLALDLKVRMDGEVLKHNAAALQASPGARSDSLQH